MEDRPHLLVVDDDRRIRELLSRHLGEKEGFRVTTAADAAEARARLRGLVFDLLIVDINMPGEDGLALTESLRAGFGVPILLLTARGEAADRVRGLELGADDYLVKPFELRELHLRIAAILRRAARAPAPASISLGECTFELSRRELRRADAVLGLTTVEGSLLSTLARNAGTTLSREELIRHCGIAGGERAVDVQVTRLRRKIEPDPRAPRFLRTVRGRGYVLHAD